MYSLNFILYSEPWTMYTVQVTVYSTQCTLYSAQSCCHHPVQWMLVAQWYGHCSLSSVHCTVYSVQCTVYSAQCAVYSLQITVYRLQCTFYSVYCTVHSVQCYWERTIVKWSLPFPQSPAWDSGQEGASQWEEGDRGGWKTSLTEHFLEIHS